jgi:hypothetical protein
MDIVPYLPYIIVSIAVIGIIIAMTVFFRVHEGFVSQKDTNNANLIAALMTIISEHLCPATEFAVQMILDKATWIPEKDVEYSDKTYQSNTADTFDDCAAMCEADIACKGFVYKPNKQCEMKKTMGSPILSEPNLTPSFKGMKTDPDPSNANRSFGIASKRPEIILTGTKQEKRRKAFRLVIKDAKGAMLGCPVPSDPYQIPATIETRIRTSVKYLEPVITKALKNITDALNCSPDIMKSMQDDNTKSSATKNMATMSSMQGAPLEGFETYEEPGFVYQEKQPDKLDHTRSRICDQAQVEAQDRANQEEEDQNSSEQCIRVATLSEEDKSRILQLRLAALTNVMKDQAMLKSILTIKTSHEQLMVIKQKAMNGELKPTCGTETLTGTTTNSDQSKAQGASLQKIGAKLGASSSIDDRMIAPIIQVLGLIRSM